MEKQDFIASVKLWMEMRDLRNRIVHDYLPELIKEIYTLILQTYGCELMTLMKKIIAVKIEE